jgi:hypothetical protein
MFRSPAAGVLECARTGRQACSCPVREGRQADTWRPANAYAYAKFANATQVPGDPAAVHIHPIGPLDTGTLFHTMSPSAHVPVVGAAANWICRGTDKA